MIEADDQYTGDHTKDVVELTLQVADALRVDDETRRGAEFGALLHDVGKIHIPNEIINKPGKLDDAEWAIMKTHTVEGQRMLERVGGVLAKVGIVVRASHERWDGGGYPDGLRGEEIPLASRIVSACDAYNAMTTDRSYRRALPISDAIAELERCSGTQFDPDVVRALVGVAVSDAARAPDWQLTLTPPEPAPDPAAAGSRARARSARRVSAGAGSVASTNSAPSASQPAWPQPTTTAVISSGATVSAAASPVANTPWYSPARPSGISGTERPHDGGDEQQLARDVGDPAGEQQQRGGLRGGAARGGEQDARRRQRGAAQQRDPRGGLRAAGGAGAADLQGRDRDRGDDDDDARARARRARVAGDPQRQRGRDHRPAQRQHAADRRERDVGDVAQRGPPRGVAVRPRRRGRHAREPCRGEAVGEVAERVGGDQHGVGGARVELDHERARRGADGVAGVARARAARRARRAAPPAR